MKYDFFVPMNLDTLKKSIEKKQPYAIMMVDTTGVDNDDYVGHMPTHVYVQQYVFNAQTGQYEPSNMKFEAYVKAPDEAIQEAETHIADYDIFKDNGFTKEKYTSEAIDVEAFKDQFNLFMKGIEKDTALVLANGEKRFAETYLDKIGCADVLKSLRQQHRLLEQGDLFKEYLRVNPLGKTMAERKNDIKTINEYITGTDNIDLTKAKWRVEAVNDFIVHYARGIKILEGDWEAYWKEREINDSRLLSEEAKKKYKNSSIKEKLNTLIEMKTIDPEAIQSKTSNCDFRRLLRGFSSGKYKIALFMQVATTGFDKSKPYPLSVGEPMQISFLAAPIVNGHIPANPKECIAGLRLCIKVSGEALSQAVQRAKNGGFNAFEHYIGCNYDKAIEYNENAKTIDAANANIINFFNKIGDINNCLIITCGKADDTSIAGQALRQLGTHAVISAPYIDYSQVIKEYTFMATNDSAYRDNVLVDPENFNGNFSLEECSKFRDGESLHNTAKKCIAMCKGVHNIIEQQYEIAEYKKRDAAKPKEATPDVKPALVDSPDEQDFTPSIDARPSVNYSSEQLFSSYDDTQTASADSQYEESEDEYITGADYDDTSEGAFADVEMDNDSDETLSNEEVGEYEKAMIVNGRYSLSREGKDFIAYANDSGEVVSRAFIDKDKAEQEHSTTVMQNTATEYDRNLKEKQIRPAPEPTPTAVNNRVDEKSIEEAIASKYDKKLNTLVETVEKQNGLVSSLINQIVAQNQMIMEMANKYISISEKVLALNEKQSEMQAEIISNLSKNTAEKEVPIVLDDVQNDIGHNIKNNLLDGDSHTNKKSESHRLHSI